MKNKKQLCCYVVDEKYLFPAMLSARQARAYCPGVDVIVFCIGQLSKKIEAFRSAFREAELELALFSSEVIDGMPMAFARFFLHRMVRDQYEAVAYIDADTQVCDDVRPLLNYHLCKGTFLAARDPMAVFVPGAICRNSRSYLASIGLDNRAAALYCNSGVLRFNLTDWEEIGSAVIAASRERVHGYRFPDQDPLNLVFGQRYQTMSYRWNFPSFFLGLDLADLIKPRILHFMSNPRPWDGPFRPWSDKYFKVYHELIEAFPEIALFWKPCSMAMLAKYHVQQYIKSNIERQIWTDKKVINQIIEIEMGSVI